jgi:hypothetical protein
VVSSRVQLRRCCSSLILPLCAFSVGAGCAAIDRGDTTTRVADAIYLSTSRTVSVRAQDTQRMYCVDGQAVVCEAPMGRLDSRRCSCPVPRP